jgi:pimeloyl-ACP methyl ester carboxylesterase
MQGIVGLPAARLAAPTRFAVPEKVVFGAADDVFSRSSPYDTAKLLGAAVPTIIPGVRHLSFISHPDQVAVVIITLR